MRKRLSAKEGGVRGVGCKILSDPARAVKNVVEYNPLTFGQREEPRPGGRGLTSEDAAKNYGKLKSC